MPDGSFGIANDALCVVHTVFAVAVASSRTIYIAAV